MSVRGERSLVRLRVRIPTLVSVRAAFPKLSSVLFFELMPGGGEERNAWATLFLLCR